MLLILDNVEQLLREKPPEASMVVLMLEILQCAPGIKLLVTSREALNLQEEWVFELGGLEFPEMEQTEKLDDYAAVSLFIQRARRLSPDFTFSEADLVGIAHICRLVEGMPLAIEICDVVEDIIANEIAKEIEASLLPERLCVTARATSQHACGLRLFVAKASAEGGGCYQLSVFRGGFGRRRLSKWPMHRYQYCHFGKPDANKACSRSLRPPRTGSSVQRHLPGG
jgi:hypothetical protein